MSARDQILTVRTVGQASTSSMPEKFVICFYEDYEEAPIFNNVCFFSSLPPCWAIIALESNNNCIYTQLHSQNWNL